MQVTRALGWVIGDSRPAARFIYLCLLFCRRGDGGGTGDDGGSNLAPTTKKHKTGTEGSFSSDEHKKGSKKRENTKVRSLGRLGGGL